MNNKGRAVSSRSNVITGIRITLDLLKAVADDLHVPGLKSVATTASTILDLIDAVQISNEDCQQFILRVWEIMAVVVHQLKGERISDISPRVLHDLRILSGTLSDTESQLRELLTDPPGGTLRKMLRRWFKVSDTADQVRRLSENLNNTLAAFHVARDIDSSLEMGRVGQRAIYIREGVDNIQATLERMEVYQTELLQFQHSSAVPNIQFTRLPDSPEIFIGRTSYVNDISRRLVETIQARLAIAGAGGLGKTTVAKAICHHPEVERSFGPRRFWVSCDKVTSVGLFVERVAVAIGGSTQTSHRLADVASAMSTISSPVLLVLDNFETALNLPGQQSDIEDILCGLASFPNVSILLTIRGTLPARHRIRWSEPILPNLDTLELGDARQLWLEIQPNAAQDENLDILLTAMSRMPLAVTLAASRARKNGETPTDILLEWEKQGPDILVGHDRRLSVNLSIEQSLRGGCVRGFPEATTLLSLLSFLPGGAYVATLATLAPTLKDTPTARLGLIESSLAYLSPDGRFIHVLLPISLYVRKHYPPTRQAQYNLRKYYFDLLSRCISKAGETFSRLDATAIGTEEKNMEAILLDALKDHTPYPLLRQAIKAAITFSQYQYFVIPQLKVATAVVTATRRMDSIDQLGRGLFITGLLQQHLFDFESATRSLQEAHIEFERSSETWGAVDCIVRLGEIEHLKGHHEEARSMLERSLEDCRRLGYARGAARCLQSLGDIDYVLRNHDQARKAQEISRKEFLETEDVLGAAQSLQRLGDNQIFQGNYTVARESLNKAQEEFVKIGVSLGVAQSLKSLGQLDYILGEYSQAQKATVEAEALFRRIGNSLGTAQCVQILGDIDRKSGSHKLDDAKEKLQAARREFIRLGNALGAAQTLRSLGALELKKLNFDVAKAMLLGAKGELEKVGQIQEVDFCQSLLLKIERAFPSDR